ncbi:MAG: sialate O-acetylesterase [Phycisphaeraceae bacterium]
MKLTLLPLLFLCLATLGCVSDQAPCPGTQTPAGKHLFILSGQSNMVGLKPEMSFTPAVIEAFGQDNIIVAKSAASGQSIRSWAKSNHEQPPPTTGRVPKVRGNLYPALINTTRAAIQDQPIQTVTLVWMQGEYDLNNTAYDAYLDELYAQLQADLDFTDINFIIGRISDAGLDNPKRLAGRLNIRHIQQTYAESHTRGAWIDTDDLNDRIKDGKPFDDLHYTPEGYKTLGERFAKAAIKLIQNPSQ